MNRPFVSAVLGTLVALVLAPAGRGQSSPEELMREIEALKEGQQQILEQIRELKAQLQAKPAAAPAGPQVRDRIFDLGANPVRGRADAALTLVEMTDYQCGFCARHARETYPSIARDYVDTGKLRYVVLDLPLEQLHPLAFKAAEASHCAGQQGKFWEMHDRLFEQQRALEPWSGHATALGLDVAAFDECLSSDRFAAAVRRDMAEAAKAGASGTPSFVLARTDPNDPTKVEGVTFLRGAQPFDSFKAAIEAALAEEPSD